MAPTFYRISGLLDIEYIAQKTVVIIGTGSLGSAVARVMAYPWKLLVLIDPDKLGPENIERHQLGYTSVGRYKAPAMRRQLIRDRGLDGDRIVAHRTTAEQVLERYGDADLVIETTGNLPLRSLINDWCYENNVPVIFAGVYPKGTGGEIVVLGDPTYSCWDCYDYDTGGFDEEDDTLNYGVGPVLPNPDTGEPEAVPYLIGPVNSIAADVQDYALDILTGVEVSNQWYVRAIKPNDLYQIPSRDVAQHAIDWQETERAMGMIPGTAVSGDEQAGFTLQGSRAIIRGNIQPSGGCRHHFSFAHYGHSA